MTIDLYHHFLSSWKAHCADSAKATIAYNLYTLNGRNNNVSANAIFSEITELTKDSLPSNTCKALFYLCVLQSITGSDNRDSKATDNLVQLLTNNLRHFSMSQIFPFREEQKAINAGLTLGVGGLGLSLLSFATNDYSWLDLCPAYEF